MAKYILVKAYERKVGNKTIRVKAYKKKVPTIKITYKISKSAVTSGVDSHITENKKLLERLAKI